MKLLELHLRNIASIESADIDFEKQEGLIDPDSGLPAQTFLIYGDTGTGKSILLDGISMALYKNTPRIADVASRQRNSFTSNSGNEVNIYSIEQYTRIGISDKDPCYSEVAFIGNDGRLCRARLELGVNRNNKYRSSWLFKAGDADWEKVDRDGKMIVNAVGLTFDQFNRMAMLAQGQFAAFLCGERKERADILEKLTNTSIFSRYGEAIKNIHDKKKKLLIAAEATLKAYDKIAISDDEAQQVEVLRDKAAGEIGELSKVIKSIEETLKHIEDHDKAVEKKEKATNELQRLDGIVAGDNYRQQLKLFQDWDNTDEQRQTLNELTASKKSLEVAIGEEKAEMENFDSLSSCLSAFIQNIGRKESALAESGQWLESRSTLDTFYTNHQVTCSNFAQLGKTLGEIRLLQEKKSGKEALTESLATALDTAKSNKQRSDKTVSDIQNVIDSLKEKIKELNPDRLDKRLEELSRFLKAYENLLNDFTDWESKQEEYRQQLTAIQQLEEKSKALKDETDTLKARNDEAQKAFNEARDRFTTINSSLDDKLSELRSRMAEEHADTCPLCGQKITGELLTREQFADIISPFAEEQQRTKELADKAFQEYDKAKNALSGIEGQLKSEHTKAKTQGSLLDKKNKELADRLAKAGISGEGSIVKDNIKVKIEEITKEQEETKKKRSEVTRLQEETNRKLDEKKPADKLKSDNDAKLLSAKNAIDNNIKEIAELGERLEKLVNESRELRQQLEKDTLPWFQQRNEPIPQLTDFEDSQLFINSAVQQIKAEAKEYIDKKKAFENGKNLLVAEKEKTDQMSSVRTQLLLDHPDWQNAPHDETAGKALTIPIAKALQSWNALANSCSATSGKKATSLASIERCNRSLEDWQLATGMDIAMLGQLMARKDDVPAARKYVEEVNSGIKTAKAQLQEASRDADDAIKALHLEEGAPMPVKEELIMLRNEKKSLENNAREAYASAVSKLEDFRKYKEQRKKDEEAYNNAKAIFDHWALLNKRFGGERFRNLVQTHILRPLLNNANIYLQQITDRYRLTCSDDNEQLSILVLDRFNRDEVRSAAVLSGGEKFMVSLALSLALSSLNRPDMNVNILFIDEGFGTLDQECLDSVMKTLARLSDIVGQGKRRVGIISHREELLGRIPNKIKLLRNGEGRSRVNVVYEI